MRGSSLTGSSLTGSGGGGRKYMGNFGRSTERGLVDMYVRGVSVHHAGMKRVDRWDMRM